VERLVSQNCLHLNWDGREIGHGRGFGMGIRMSRSNVEERFITDRQRNMAESGSGSLVQRKTVADRIALIKYSFPMSSSQQILLNNTATEIKCVALHVNYS
jgi:hypothetical protein